jgi:Flp pilus assembly protein TadD
MSAKGVVATLAAAGLWTGAYATATAQSIVTPDEIMSGELLGVTADSRPSIRGSEVLALNDDMRRFLRQHVNTGATDTFKLQQLVDAMMGTTSFKLEYDEQTRTAAETFRLQRGNCLSFTTLFVTLARGVNLKAKFQEVDIPPDWSTRRDLFVLNIHVNVSVDLGGGGVRAVDFNVGDFQSTYKVKEISDQRAVAHFFNNMGVESMEAGDIVEAVVYFRQAIIESDGVFSPAWTNLGLLYRQSGHLDYAEAAYLQAIEVDRGDYVAMSNLVSLYEEQGDQEEAESYRRKVDQHRMRNPHLRYSLGREAFADRDFDAAIAHVKFAINKEKGNPEYAFFLGLCYLMKGDEDRARSWVAKAQRLAETDEEKRRYQTTFEELLDARRN